MRLSLALFPFLIAGCGEAAVYKVAPVPALLPSLTVTATEAVPVLPGAAPLTLSASPTPTPAPRAAHARKKGTDTATPTASPSPTVTPTATPAIWFYLLPFEDRRSQKDIYHGRSQYESVAIQAEGISLAAKAWNQAPYGSVALLWHRQLGQALSAAGYNVIAPEDPPTAMDTVRETAARAGARYLVRGTLKRLEFEKSGAVAVSDPKVSGTGYTLKVQVVWLARDVQSGRKLGETTWDFERSVDAPTFPELFARGLDAATAGLAGEDELRAYARLPVHAPTPTAAATAKPTPYSPTAPK